MRCGAEYNIDIIVDCLVRGKIGGKKSLQEFTDTESVKLRNYGRYDSMGIKNLNKLLSEEAPEVNILCDKLVY